MTEPVKQVYDDRGYFEGWTGRWCGDHRTVGSYRAWCYDCAEWCYPRLEAACVRCRVPVLERELEELRSQVKTVKDLAEAASQERDGMVSAWSLKRVLRGSGS